MQIAIQPELCAELWQAHKTELIAEAQAAGFVPVATTWFDEDGQLLDDIEDTPMDSDPHRAAWSARFCDEHGH